MCPGSDVIINTVGTFGVASASSLVPYCRSAWSSGTVLRGNTKPTTTTWNLGGSLLSVRIVGVLLFMRDSWSTMVLEQDSGRRHERMCGVRALAQVASTWEEERTMLQQDRKYLMVTFCVTFEKHIPDNKFPALTYFESFAHAERGTSYYGGGCLRRRTSRQAPSRAQPDSTASICIRS